MPFLLSTSPPPAFYPLAANPLGECSSDSSWPSASPPPLLMHYFVGQVIWILTLMPPWLKVSIFARRQLISGCLTFGRNPWSIIRFKSEDITFYSHFSLLLIHQHTLSLDHTSLQYKNKLFQPLWQEDALTHHILCPHGNVNFDPYYIILYIRYVIQLRRPCWIPQQSCAGAQP